MEKSAGFVIYRKENNRAKFLLLKYPSEGSEGDYWGLPKGHIEKKEKPLETAKRELFEETGIKEEDIEVNPEFRKWIKYFFKRKGGTIFKIVIYFLAKTKRETIKISQEHSDYEWVYFEEALNKISFKNTARIIKDAEKFI